MLFEDSHFPTTSSSSKSEQIWYNMKKNQINNAKIIADTMFEKYIDFNLQNKIKKVL